MNNRGVESLIRAGLIPLPAWLFFVTLAGFFAADYSPIASHASMMTLLEGPALYLTNTAAWVSGVALLLFGLGVWIFSGRIFAAGAFCWMVFGVAMCANGTWPTGSPLHGLYAIGIFNILSPALSLLDVRNETLQKKLYPITVFCSLMAVFYLWILLTGLDPEGYAGLTQRVFGTINFLWPLVFAWQFGKLART